MRPELLDYEILSKAREWLKVRRHWVKNNFGIGRKYQETNDLQDATATCAVGALARAAGVDDMDHIQKTHAFKLLEEAVPKNYGRDITGYNDKPETTHTDILNLFTRAMTKAKKLATAPLRG